MRTDALSFVRLNLDTNYSDAEWQALWEACVDPAATRNAGGFNFVALPAPEGWTLADPANWCLSAESARGLLRVRVPQQIIATTFGRVLGVNELQTNACAHARIFAVGEGGILPFGLPSGLGDGGHVCLSAAPAGLSENPCASAQGNFRTLKGAIFGNPDIPTNESMQNCNASPTGDVLARNIAHGYDYIVVADPDASVTNEVRDECRNPFVDTLNTDTGFPNNGAEEGLVGPVPMDGSYSYTPRLAQSPVTIAIKTGVVDDRPLWIYLDSAIDYGGGATIPITDDAPWQCDPATFDNSPAAFSGGDYDWDDSMDMVEEPNESWEHMDNCINAYVSGSFLGDMFLESVIDNKARFGYVPEFYETNLGTGNSWLHIKRFRAIYLLTTLWRNGNRFVIHSPGEPCYEIQPTPGDITCPTGNGGDMIQLTASVIPDEALPVEIAGAIPGPGGSLNPFYVELVR